MRRAIGLLVSLAACTGASGTSSPSPRVADHRGDRPLAARDRHTHASALPSVGGIEEDPVPACPPEPDLVPRLRELWQVAPDAAIDVVACVRGRFRGHGWLVDAFIDLGDQESESRVAVVAAGGGGLIAELDPADASRVDRFDAAAGNGWQVVDLDGDGVDELLQLQEWNHVAALSTQLAVFRLDGAAIRRVGVLDLAHDNKGAKGMTARRVVQCSSQHALADAPDGTRTILVEGTITTAGRQAGPIAAAHCPLPGAHHYRLVGGALEEVKP
ncbi:MAG TPA: hypothetical protein VFU21_27970 [Kofleriaceae bacterium]|nr:hypothetical protein [Kofleriaceae bacterium]